MNIKKLASKIILAAESYSHGCLMAPVPEIIYEEIKEISRSIPIEDLALEQNNTIHGIESRPHITIMYGTDGDNSYELIKNIFNKPLRIKLTNVIEYFDNDDASVAHIKIDSPDLIELNKKLAEIFPFKNPKYSVYKPHMTLAYLKPGKRINVDFKPIEFETKYAVLSTQQNEIKNIYINDQEDLIKKIAKSILKRK